MPFDAHDIVPFVMTCSPFVVFAAIQAAHRTQGTGPPLYRPKKYTYCTHSCRWISEGMGAHAWLGD